MGKLNLTDLDMMAMFRVAIEVARTDGNLTENDFKVLDKYLQPLNMSDNRMERFIKTAMIMDYQDAIEALKEMGPELKQYASNFIAEVILSDGEVGDAENDAYDRILDCCGLPFTTIGQDNNGGANTNTAKYTVRELCAIESAFDVVWNGNDTGLDLRKAFHAQYDVYNEEDFPSDEENDTKDVDIAARVLKAMSDEKKEEVSQLLSDVVVARDPDEDLMCGEDQVLGYYKFVTKAEMSDLLSDRTLDYKGLSQGGSLPDGLEFSILDIYMVFNWLSDRCTYSTYIDFDKLDSFIGSFYIEPVVLFELYISEYPPFVNVLNDYDVADRLSDLGENEQLFISRLMADYITEGTDLDNQSEAVNAYEWLFEEYGFPNELDENKLSKVEVHEASVTTDLFIGGVSCTKIKVTFTVNDQKDASCRCFATFYHANDDTPCPEKSIYGLDGELTAQGLFYPLYDSSRFTDFEIDIPNDVLPLNEKLYVKLRFCNDDDPAGTYIGTYNKKLHFTPTKNEYDPDQMPLLPTYIAVSFYEKDAKKIPGDYRDYRPCTLKFEQIMFDLSELKKRLGTDELYFKSGNARLDKISEKLDLNVPEINDDVKLVVLYDLKGAHGYNKLRDFIGPNLGNSYYFETLVIGLQSKENEGTIYGFRRTSQLRDVIKALDEAVYGMAYNGPVYDQPALSASYERRFWQQVETGIANLQFYDEKPSEKATLVTDGKSVVVNETKVTQVVLNGENHIRLTMNCRIDACKGIPLVGECELCYAVDKTPCSVSDYKYMQGLPNHFCVSKVFKPSYDSSTYSDIEFDFLQRLMPKKSQLCFILRFYLQSTFKPLGKSFVSQTFKIQ